MEEKEQIISGFDDADMDDGWGHEDGDSMIEDSAESDNGGEGAEAEGETKESGEGAPAESDGEEALQEVEQAMIDYEYKGKQERMSIDEARPLLAMGREYPALRAELERMRKEVAENESALRMIDANAQRMNKSRAEFLQWWRVQEKVREGMSEAMAEQAIRMEDKQAELDAREARINAQMNLPQTDYHQAVEQASARRNGMQEFLKARPDVKPADIPTEVWKQVREGVPLVNAYAMYENAKLRAQMAAQKQNEENQKKSTGGLGVNSGNEWDELDRLWAQDDD